MDINLIKPYEKNAKKHPKKQIQQVANSIKEFGFNQPIVVDKNNVIIVGHGRYEASKLLGLEEVPVKVVDLTEEQAKAYRLADNKLNESDWDMDLVIQELKDLDSEELVELSGFEKDLLIEPEDKDDDVPDAPEEPTAKLGDIYQLGTHRIMCGDSTKVEDVEALMDGTKADLVVTDPPYNVDYEGKTKDALKIENDKKSDNEFCLFLIEAFKRMNESIKLGASFYIWHADSEGFNFRKACKESGLLIRQCIIWNKNSLVMGRQDYQWKHEPCLYGWKEGSTHNWYGDRDKTTVYKIPEDEKKAFKWFKNQLKRQENKNTSIVNHDRPTRSSEHPTMKPVELLEKQVINSSKQEDVVLDTFLGSGSTLIACEKTNRICYGMELDPKYIDVIIKRWEDYTGNKAEKIS